VITSVAHQFGSLSKIAPNFWKYVLHQDWPNANQELQNWNGKSQPDEYSNRRNSEASILNEIIAQNGKIKSNSLTFLA
jgi:hypothetical protein